MKPLLSLLILLLPLTALPQVTIEVNSLPTKFNDFNINIKAIEFSEQSTIVYKLVTPKKQGISVCSEKAGSIIDANTGESYNIIDSSLGFIDNQSTNSFMSTLALVETYPPLPSSVTKINITSNENNYYTNDLQITSQRKPTNADLEYAFSEFNLAQDYAASNHYNDAFIHYKNSALKLGLSMAQFEVAVGYERGEGVSVNFPNAFYWMYKAGTNKVPDTRAFLYLGVYYREGIGTFVNYEKSLKYFMLGSEQCYIEEYKDECKFYIGVAYQYGLGVEANLVEACKWYQKAAEHGHTVASNNLGNRYARGEGVPNNYKEAEKWWIQAASKGYLEAQMSLGILYEHGSGNVKKDKKQAIYWYTQAANQGYTEAIIALQKIQNE